MLISVGKPAKVHITSIMRKEKIMANKTLTPNEMSFVQTMLMNGNSLTLALSLIGKSLDTANTVSNKYQPKVDNKPKADKSASTKATTKGSKAKIKSPKGDKQPTSKAGNVKKGDYFKVVVNDKITAIGKAEAVDTNAKSVKSVNGKQWVLGNCYAITKATYGKLSKRKSLKKFAEPKGKTTQLSAADYKVVYCFNLLKNGRIAEEDFNKAKNEPNYATELYKQFKDQVKLSSSDAMKMLAENSDKSSTQA